MSKEYLNNKALEDTIDKFQRTRRDKIRCELIVRDLQGKVERKKKRKLEIVRDRKMLSDMLTVSIRVANQHDEYQQDLAVSFYILAENIVRYAKFNLIDPDDAVQEGVVICFEKIDRFDSAKGRAFNYMTTCILNHFRQLYRTARNYNELKKKFHEFQQIRVYRSMIRNGKEYPVYSSKSI